MTALTSPGTASTDVAGGGAADPGVERELPLSPTQERLWFLHRLRPDDAAYNLYPTLRLRGRLAADALQRAVTEIVRRHEPLRSRFPDRHGEPVQLVAPAGPHPINWVDLTGVPAADREARMGTVVSALAAELFDLATGPLLRVNVVRLGPEEHVLQVVLHHVIADGWSVTVLVRELADLYEAYRKGLPSPLPELPLRYGDYVLRQRARLDAPEVGETLDFWLRQLADPPVLELPTDRPRPPVMTSAGGIVERWVSRELTVAVEQLARQQRCTLFMTLFAAYQVLLARHSGQRDILIGVPLAGRENVDLEPLIGYLTTTVVLRGDLSDDPTFATLLRRTRGSVLQAFANQEIPVERLLGELGVERDLSRPALVQTAFAMQNQQTEPPDFEELAVVPYYADFQQAKFDLQLDAYRATNMLLNQFGYNSDLFDRATVERLADRYEHLLAAAVADPNLRVSELPMLADGEEDQLLAWSGAPALDVPSPPTPGRQGSALPPDLAPAAGPALAAGIRPGAGAGAATVLDAVVAQAGRTPDAVAVRAGAAELSYAGLVAAADRLASALVAAGAGRESIVGVCLPRTPDLLVALLAVWKAGAAYLPLDPNLPAERRDHLLADSGAALLLVPPSAGAPDAAGAATGDGRAEPARTSTTSTGTGTGTGAPNHPAATATTDGTAEPAGTGSTDTDGAGVSAPGTGAPGGVRVLAVDSAPPAGAAAPSGRPAPGDAAYVIYTSGSTGRPKGVLVEHGSLATRVAWMIPAYGIGPADQVLQFASIGFDTSAEEIWPTLSAGGTCVLLPDGAALLPDFLATPAGAAITVLDLPTSYWHELLALGDRLPWPAALRLVVLGGSELQESAVAGWRARFGDRVRVVNTYGPTEATIVATAAEVGPDDTARRPTIGSPVERAYVLDEHLRLAPIGVPGELCVGGAGVARGYLGQPGLTADRFVPDPYGPPGARLYRTGDRARWRPDGRLEFLGRLDGQLKVRGHRVEPGEIEARLREHPQVADAVVVADGDRLIGYFVPAHLPAPRSPTDPTATPDTGPPTGPHAAPLTGPVTGPPGGPYAGPEATPASGPPTGPGAGAPSGAQLRAALARVLPAYLVPAVFVPLERLPLTPNGKLNRRALPAPDPVVAGAGGQAPRTPAEELVAEVWAEVLGVEQVGVGDDFFALGGHSLLVTKVTARLRDAIDLEIPVRAAFENPSLEGLAAAVEELLLADIERLEASEVDGQLAAGA